jgi:hypothetical protein
MAAELSPYDYSRISEAERKQLPIGFRGDVLNMSYKWATIIPLPADKPWKILEIGVYHGANVCNLVKTYAAHPSSEIHCVDPWMDVPDYPEYRNQQPTNYSNFIHNIALLDPVDLQKIYPYRKLSEEVVPGFSNESFDLIYVDGNHTKPFVLEDATMVAKKVKRGGWLVFDDTHHPDVSVALQAFLSVNAYRFEEIKIQNSQLFMRRRHSD